MRNIFIVILLLYVTGCSTTAPLVPVAYEKAASVTTDQTATIKLDTGTVTGSSGSTLMSAGNNVFVPIYTGPVYSLHFGEEDQLTFLSSLSSELTRIGVLNVLQSGKKITLESDQKIRVIFLRTHHDPEFQVYTLDVAFQIQGNKRSFANKYHIVSHTSITEKLFTNASQGKEKAAKKLMVSLVEDIQRYLSKQSNANASIQRDTKASAD
ncbi:MAG: hypothetical protein OIF51_16000 [Cellvibrionaceae bacterium]|nr:hypothetical protein [Cellvibrionaceae bacterium]